MGVQQDQVLIKSNEVDENEDGAGDEIIPILVVIVIMIPILWLRQLNYGWVEFNFRAVVGKACFYTMD